MEGKTRRRLLVLTLTGLLVLTGCTGQGASAKSRVQAAQKAYGALKSFTAQAEVTADYGERVYGYTVDLKGDQTSGTMKVTEPENIAGSVLAWNDGKTELEYDGTALDTGALSSSGLSPADAMPAVLTACRSGEIIDCCTDTLNKRDTLYATLETDDKEKCRIACWFRPDNYALSQAEVSQNGQVVITLRFTAFSFQTEGES